MISNYSGYEVSDMEQELMNDPDFLFNLKVISCEIDISKYINPKSVVFMKIFKKMYQKNKEHQIKKQFDNVLNNPDKIEKIKNLNLNK